MASTTDLSRRMASDRASQHAFLGVSALVFAASAAGTIVWCTSMSAMGEMPMPGCWTMSMTWTRLPGQPWPAAAASFLGMWVVMMVAMMLPSLVPLLWHYREGIGTMGATRTVPVAVGVVVLIAGVFQFTASKARHLACCREVPGRGLTRLPANAGTAWRYGLRLGLHCTQCCAGLMAILLVVGVMNLRATAVMATVITVERLAPASERVVRTVGAVVVGTGLVLIVQAAGLG